MLIVVSLLIPPYNLKHFPKTFGPLKLSLTHTFPQIFVVTKQKSKEILERDGRYLNCDLRSGFDSGVEGH